MVFISLVEKDTQKRLLDYFFKQCTNFSVMYPEGTEATSLDNPLLAQKENFLRLKNTHITKWSGIENGIKISGLLTSEVQHLFYLSLQKKGMWCYSLFFKEDEVFSVSDFDVGQLKISQNEITSLIQKEIINSNDLMQ